MSSPSLFVQRALVAALRADTDIAAIASGVFDGVAPDAALPYVTVGAGIVTDWSHKSGRGREHRVSVNVWDDAAGTAQVQRLMARLEAAIDTLAGAADGHRIASTLFVRSFVTTAVDGATQGVVEYRIRTESIQGD
jgi:hypothetical protein